MRPAMWKITFREIKRTLGRYLTILAIVALGVGFFVGLKITRPVMIATVDEYIVEQSFYDYEVISGLGLTEDDVAAFAALSDVRTAAGAISADVLYVSGEDELVMAVHSITEGVNESYLVAGRMPESADECVVDSRLMSEEDIGTFIEIAADNEEDTLEMFAYDSYEVVGIIQSPLYINYERGTSSIGSGSVAGFMFIQEDGFDCDYYTEIYLKYDMDYEIYSDEYEEYLDAHTDEADALLALRVENRRNVLVADAEKEIADAEETLNDAYTKLTDGEEELSSARQEATEGWEELESAREELESGEEELSSAKQEVESGEEELESAREELESGGEELASAKEEIASGEEELASAKEELLSGEEELASAKAEIASGEEELRGALEELLSGEEELASGKAEVSENELALAQAKAELDAAETQIASGKAEVESSEATLAEGLEELESTEQLLGELREVYNAASSTLTGQDELLSEILEAIDRYSESATDEVAAYMEQFAESIRQLDTEQILSALDLALVSAEEEVAAGWEEYYDGLDQLAAAKAEIAAAEEETAAGWKEYNDGAAQLAEAKKQLQAAEEELAAGWEAYYDGVEELDAAKEEVAAAEEELSGGWSSYYDGMAELGDAKSEVADGSQTLADGWKSSYDGLAEIADAKQTISESENELDDGWEEYYEGLTDYEEGLQEIGDAEAELDDGWAEYYDGVAELEDARQEVEDLKTEEVLTYLLGRDSNVGYVCFESDSMIVDNIANIFPVFFFAVALLVCITTMNRMVDEGRTQIGVLKALGYGRGSIIGEYIFYAGSAALLGGVLGFAVGSVVFPVIIWYAYGIMYEAGGIVLVFSVPYLIFSVLVALACSLGATFFSCYVEFISVPSELMRPKAPKVGKRVFIERITPLWKRLSFLTKVSLRNVFRYKKRFLMMVLGVSGCTALLLTALGLRDSILHVGDSQYERIQLYDIEAVLKNGADDDKMDELSEEFSDVAADIMYFHEDSADLIANGVTKSATLIVAYDEAQFDDFWKLFDEDGNAIAYPGESEAVITDKLADRLNVEVGDTITVRNSDLRESTVTVTGIATNYVYNYIYLSQETCENSLKTEPEYKYLCVRVPDDVDVHEASTEISGCEDVLTITINVDVQTRLSNMMDSLNAVVVLVIICAALLAFIVLYNLTNINIIERVREIATLKVLGFYPNETSQYVFRENFMLTAVGTAAGLVLGIWLHRFVMVNIDVDIVSFDITIKPLSYVLAVILTSVFALLVDFSMYFKLEKINMAESLKTIE